VWQFKSRVNTRRDASRGYLLNSSRITIRLFLIGSAPRHYAAAPNKYQHHEFHRATKSRNPRPIKDCLSVGLHLAVS